MLLINSADVLPPTVCASPCVAAALALVAQCELPEGAALAALEHSLTPVQWEAARVLRRAHDTLDARAADDTLEALDADSDDNADHAAAERSSFRVASLRGGAHPFGSLEVNAALGAAVHEPLP